MPSYAVDVDQCASGKSDDTGSVSLYGSVSEDQGKATLLVHTVIKHLIVAADLTDASQVTAAHLHCDVTAVVGGSPAKARPYRCTDYNWMKGAACWESGRPLSDVWTYHNPTYTDLSKEARNFSIGGDVPFFTVAGDYLYWGNRSAKFTAVDVDLYTMAAYSGSPTLLWEYSTGASTWPDFVPGTDLFDLTNNFTQDGVVSWADPGAAWAKDTVNGISAYWVRVSTATAITTSPVANRMAYSWTAGIPFDAAVYDAEFWPTDVGWLDIDVIEIVKDAITSRSKVFNCMMKVTVPIVGATASFAFGSAGGALTTELHIEYTVAGGGARSYPMVF